MLHDNALHKVEAAAEPELHGGARGRVTERAC